MMGHGRILHLAFDEKFIDYAYQSFENVAPGLNDFLVFVDSDHSYIKKTPYRAVRRRDRLGLSLRREIARYDLVVIHSLHKFWIPVINSCSASAQFVWVGWGFDYYDIIYPDSNDLLLEATWELKRQAQQTTQPAKRPGLAARLNAWLERLCLNSDKRRAISRIRYFAPVLPNEYPLVSAAYGSKPFPQQAVWNYGSLEEVWVKDFIGQTYAGQNILIGNSAFHACNQLDILNWLSDVNLSERRVLCTLSYGDEAYAKLIRQHGERLLPSNFQALMDFIPLSEYVGLVSSCSHVLMNHVRQQGMGILLIMLYLGSVVFLREENPALHYLRRLGFFVRTMQELMQNPRLLDQRLSMDEIQHNKELLQQHWSKLVIDDHTRQLIANCKK